MLYGSIRVRFFMKKNLKNVKKFEKVGYFKNPIRVHSEGGKTSYI